MYVKNRYRVQGEKKRLEKQIKILTIKDCSGERFPKHKNKKIEYKSPVIYYGKKIF